MTHVASGQSRAEMLCIVKVCCTHRVGFILTHRHVDPEEVEAFYLCVDVICWCYSAESPHTVDVFITVCCFLCNTVSVGH